MWLGLDIHSNIYKVIVRITCIIYTLMVRIDWNMDLNRDDLDFQHNQQRMKPQEYTRFLTWKTQK